MSWEDRERVLKLLFAKINNQSQQVYFTQLPQHPLEAPEGGGGRQLQGLASEAGPAGIV